MIVDLSSEELLGVIKKMHKEGKEGTVEFKTAVNTFHLKSFLESSAYFIDGDFYQDEFFVISHKEKADIATLLNALSYILSELIVVEHSKF